MYGRGVHPGSQDARPQPNGAVGDGRLRSDLGGKIMIGPTRHANP
jgi:hypothetical protein